MCVRVVTEHTFMLGSIFGKQSTCLNADRVGVNCIFAISFMSEMMMMMMSRNIIQDQYLVCLSLIHASADFQQNVRRPCRCRNFMMCYSAHRFFLFSISPEHNVGGMQPLDRNEWVRYRLVVLPSMAIIIFRDILCCTAHIPSYLFFFL